MPDDTAPRDTFAALDAEVALWAAAGLRLPLWLRDDDATEPSPALDRLIDGALRWGLPLHLAVIPAGAVPALADRVADAPGVRPLVHGWAHANHEARGAKKCEFGPARPAAAALDDAARGLARMRVLFGARVVPVFVPPWNRIAPDVAAGLRTLGYAALSAAPGATPPVAGLPRLDRHFDPVDWRGTRSLAPPQRLVAWVVEGLAARRLAPATGRVMPYGVLTHHLAHDDAIWRFLDALIPRLTRIAMPLDLSCTPLEDFAP